MATQVKIPAVYMRGGTSKGVFFYRHHLPEDSQRRDAMILRVLGSPDPYGKQMDGLGGATSSTSKVAILSSSQRPECDVDYLFGHVAIQEAYIDYSGNCGNLTAAVACFAVEEQLIQLPTVGHADQVYDATVRIWQVNTNKKIIAKVPCCNGAPLAVGDYEMAGVPSLGARIALTFLDPAGAGGDYGFLPTGELVTELTIPKVGTIQTSLVDAGNPTVFIRARDVGLTGCELPNQVNTYPELLQKLEAIRSHAAVRMGLVTSPEQATRERPATPKIALLAPVSDYHTSAGQLIKKTEIDILARILSMGQFHHAFTGTGAISLAAAAAVPGTLVAEMIATRAVDGSIRIGHVAGVMDMQAEVENGDGQWTVKSVTMGRTARRLMEGNVLIPRF